MIQMLPLFLRLANCTPFHEGETRAEAALPLPSMLPTLGLFCFLLYCLAYSSSLLSIFLLPARPVKPFPPHSFEGQVYSQTILQTTPPLTLSSLNPSVAHHCPQPICEIFQITPKPLRHNQACLLLWPHATHLFSFPHRSASSNPELFKVATNTIFCPTRLGWLLDLLFGINFPTTIYSFLARYSSFKDSAQGWSPPKHLLGIL